MQAWAAVFAVLPIARLADRRNRRDIVAVALLVWAIGTTLSGCFATYGGLLAARAIVGLGTAGFRPVAVALLTDFFPPEERGRAFGIFALGWQSGNLFGYIGGGGWFSHGP
jgi:MFS family permease